MTTNKELIERYIKHYSHSPQSQRMRRSALKYFFEKFGYDGPIFEITTGKLIDFFDFLKNLPNLKFITKKSKWIILTSFMNFLMEFYPEFNIKIPSKAINWNGVRNEANNDPNRKSNSKIFATKEEIVKILQHIKNRNIKHYMIVRIFIETGMRLGELINMKTDEIDLDNGVIHTFVGKTGEKYYFVSK